MPTTKTTPSKLIAAVQRGDADAVNAALDDGADIEEADMHGMPGLPLRTACFSGDLAIVRELARRGANINAPGSEGPGMPLRLALRCRHLVIVDELIGRGADIPDNAETPPPLNRGAETPEEPIPLLPTEAATPVFAIVDEDDAATGSGTETSLLTMDLLRFNESENDPVPTPSRERNAQIKAEVDSEKNSFWDTGSNFR